MQQLRAIKSSFQQNSLYFFAYTFLQTEGCYFTLVTKLKVHKKLECGVQGVKE